MISCENRIQLLFYYTFTHTIHSQKQKRSVQPFCFWGERSKGLSNQADVELDMINAISAADIAFIIWSSQTIVNWLNALDQSDFSLRVWCIIKELIRMLLFLIVNRVKKKTRQHGAVTHNQLQPGQLANQLCCPNNSNSPFLSPRIWGYIALPGRWIWEFGWLLSAYPNKNT